MTPLTRAASCLIAALALFPSGPARASTPNAIYVFPSQVDFLPDQATATKVIIHGAFFFWQNGGTYSAPKCGYMYFTCPPGSEAMCRMQWGEINNGISGQFCDGFGTMNMMTTATLRTEGTVPANPDTYDLGMGVAQGQWVGGQCGPAMALSCLKRPPPDMSIRPSDDFGIFDPLDMNPPPVVDMAMKNAAPDLSSAMPGKPTGGACSVAVNGSLGTGLAALWGTLLGAVILRRRRRS